ncbi:MAG: hypothetical protein WC314_20410 [Vulcanimicrobiota bacterium]
MVNGVNSTFATVFHLDKKLATLEACTEPYTGHLWGVEEQPVARVEKLTRQMGCRIIITASTRAGLGPHYRLRELGATTVKGRQTPVQLDGVDGRID